MSSSFTNEVRKYLGEHPGVWPNTAYDLQSQADLAIPMRLSLTMMEPMIDSYEWARKPEMETLWLEAWDLMSRAHKACHDGKMSDFLSFSHQAWKKHDRLKDMFRH